MHFLLHFTAKPLFTVKWGNNHPLLTTLAGRRHLKASKCGTFFPKPSCSTDTIVCFVLNHTFLSDFYNFAIIQLENRCSVTLFFSGEGMAYGQADGGITQLLLCFVGEGKFAR